MNTSTAASFFFLMLVVSCGGGGQSVNKIPFGNEEKLTADNPTVVPDHSFRNGMGLLLIRKSGDLAVCTSFMVGPKLLMTNSHCIDEISLTQNCSESIGVHVRSHDGFHFRRCSRILSKSDIGGDTTKPDYAVIELDEAVSTTPMTMSREGVIEGAELTIESVDYTFKHNSIYGKRKVSKCVPHTNTVLGNYAVAKSSIIPLFGDTNQSCKIIKGNSGSPVFNAADKVVSVLFATFDREELGRSAGRTLNRNMALATNIACIRTGVAAFDAQRPLDCDRIIRDEKEYLNRLQQTVDHGGKEERKKKAELMRHILPPSFMFDLEEKKINADEEKYSFNYLPRCMKNPSGWTEEEQLKIKTDPVAGRKYSTFISNYAFAVKIVFDEFLRPSPESSVVASGGYELIVENIDQGGNSITVKIATQTGGRVVTTQKTIPMCL